MFIEELIKIKNIDDVKESINYLISELNYSYDDIISEYQRELDRHAEIIEKFSDISRFEKSTNNLIKRAQKKIDKFESGDKNINYEDYIGAKETVEKFSNHIIEIKNNCKRQIEMAEIELKKYRKELARIKGVIYQLKSQEEEQIRKEHLEKQIKTRDNSIFIVYGD